MSVSTNQKIIYSIFGGFLFMAFSNPKLYDYIDKYYLGNKNKISFIGCPTFAGHLFFTVLYFVCFLFLILIFNLTFAPDNRTNFEKLFNFTFVNSLLFYMFSNREMFHAMDSYLENNPNKCFQLDVAQPNGCPTFKGIMCHSLIYTLIIFLTMNFYS